MNVGRRFRGGARQLSAKRSHSKQSRRHRLDLESLEPRVLLSALVHAVGTFAGDASPVGSYLPPSFYVMNPGGYLSQSSANDPLAIAEHYLESHAADMGLNTSDFSDITVTDQYTDTGSGTTHIYFQQRYQGLDIVNTSLTVTVTANGSVLNAAGEWLPKLSEPTSPAPMQLVLSPTWALTYLQNNGAIPDSPISMIQSPQGADMEAQMSAPLASDDPIQSRLEYLATANGLVLAWNFVVRTTDLQHWYSFDARADNAQLLRTVDWIDHATYDVYPWPTEAPNEGQRVLLTNPADPAASPFGWQDTNGVAGAEYTDTRGNNVFAQEDTNADNAGGFRPDGGASLNFDFPIDLTQAPSTYQSAAITNLFYWNNLLHDVHYKYGFTEAAGNFQVMNYTGQGLGNDAVQADAQDGSGTNNANFATPPDGPAPRMQMYLFTYTTPSRDGDLDAEVVVHEYGHGVTNRLTGGPANASALTALQSGGMGEGWSDWWSLMFTQDPSDTQNAAYPVGTYVLGQATTGAGIRRYPYSYNMTINPQTISAFNSSNEVHNAGELWCDALWDMNWLLVDKYGFNANIAAGYTGAGSAGNILALQLVMDALKIQPANPSFKDARDAILQADQVLTGGANQFEIWTAFARRGMGYSFVDAAASSATVTQAFDLPLSLQNARVASQTPSGVSTTPVSGLDLVFSRAMDPTSFTISADVDSFTGPGGADLKSTITSFTWTNSNQTLHLNFNPVSANGLYTIVVGPQILDSSGKAMDQNANGTVGEATDTYTGTFRYDSLVGQVVTMNPPSGSLVSIPIGTVDLTFNEPFAQSSVTASDLVVSQGTVTGVSFPDAQTVRFSLAGQSTENAMTLSIAAGAITDAYGNPMAAFTGTLQLDIGTVAFPIPLTLKGAPGTLIYDGSASSLINTPTDSDSFTLTLDANQTLSLIATPAGTLRPRIELRDPTQTLIAAANAPSAAAPAWLQALTISTAGTYTITVSSADGTSSGAVTVRAILNAALEAEHYNGPTDDTIATAQNLDGAFGTAYAASGASIASVLGKTPAATGVAVVSEDFESGLLGPAWSTYSSLVTGEIAVSNVRAAAAGSYALYMDNNDATGAAYNLNEAVWTVNLTSVSAPTLVFSTISYSDETDVLTTDFTGHANGDGVSISSDGTHWHTIWTNASPTVWTTVTVDLAAAAATAGMTLGANFKIKFQQYDNYNISTDGCGYDAIAITTPANANDYYSFTLAANQTASAGLAFTSGSASATLSLLNAAGTPLATGSATTNFASLISGFAAPVAGTYYISVVANAATDYALTISKNAALGLESNDTLATAQNLAGQKAAYGYISATSGLGRLYVYENAGDIKELNPITGAVLRTFTAPTTTSNGPDFGLATTTTSLLAAGITTSPIYELNPDTGAVIRTIPNPSIGVSGLAFMNNEIFALTDAVAGSITVFDYATGAVKRTITAPGVAEGLGSSSTTLYGSTGSSAIYRIDPLTGASTLLANLTNSSNVEGVGVIGNELFVCNFNVVDVYDLTSLAYKRTFSTGIADMEAVGADGGAGVDNDYYAFPLIAGQTFVASTQTPAFGAGEFVNTFDPAIDLYDPTGTLVATNDNSAPDGRNALLTYTPLSSGTYTIRVRSTTAAATQGEYFLSAGGNYVNLTAPADVHEGDGVFSGTVSVNTAPTTDLVVNLTSADPARITVPASVTIAAGQLSAPVAFTVVDNSILDGLEQVTINASATGYSAGTQTVTVHDNETAALTVSLPAGAREGVGPVAGVVTSSLSPTRNITIQLSSSLVGRATVPATITLLAGQTTASFSLSVVDNAVIDGTQGVNISAAVENWTSGSAVINIADNDATLAVTLPASGWEGQTLAAAGTVRIGGTLASDLVVSLLSSDTTELTVPPTVTILAGQTTATFNLSLVADSLRDGNQTAQVTASAAGLAPASSTLIVHDADLDHVAFDAISGPKTAAVPFAVTLRALNVAGETISVSSGSANLSATGTGGSLTISPTSATFASGIWTGNVAVNAVDPSVTLRADAGNGITTTSGAFAVQAGTVASFQWNTIPTPQNALQPFAATLTAKDANGFTATTFAGTVNLTGQNGAGVLSQTMLGSPVYTTSANNGAYTVGYLFTPNTNLQVTHVRSYFGTKVSIWTNTGTLLASQVVSGTAMTWTETALQTPLSLVAGTTYRITVYTANQIYYWRTSAPANPTFATLGQTYEISGDAFPTTTDTGQYWLVDLRANVGSASAVAITPSTATFSNGVWSGNINALQAASAMHLHADDGAGHTGDSNNFDVTGTAAPLTPDLLDATDSGFSTTDNNTNFNNSTLVKALKFQVGGTIPGATVTLYANGVAVGSAAAVGSTTTVTTDGTTLIADGPINFTARQTVAGQGQSLDSSALAVTIDSAAPATPVAPDLQTASDSGVSTTDNITAVKTPAFTVAGAPYYRFYINGIQAAGDYLSAATYTLPTQADGVYTYGIAAVDIAGNVSATSSLSVTIDSAAPYITSSSIQGGAVLAVSSTFTYTATFSEAMAATSLDTTDFSLLGLMRNVTYTPTSFVYGTGNTVLTLTYTNLPEDNYTLTLLSGDARFEDVAGNDLDGEANFPMPPNHSGNGTAGGNFVLNFSSDSTTSAFPTPLTAKLPMGSLIYDPTVIGAIGTVGDTDSYTLALDAGQTLTLQTSPGATLRPTIELRSPSNVLLASATASAAGVAALLQTVPISAAGTYTITISGAGSTTGAYTLGATLNAALEAENYGGATDNSRATAQNIGASFIDLGSNSTRAAVLGKADLSAGAGADYYAFSVSAGDKITIAYKSLGSTPIPTILLQNAAGLTLATATAGPTNVDKAISNFTVASAGTYYIFIDGTTAVGDYSLIVNRNAAFDLEGNNTFATSEDTANQHTVLGAIVGGSATPGAIRMGLIQDQGSWGNTTVDTTVATGLGFTVTTILSSTLSTVNFSNFDLVVLAGDQSTTTYTNVQTNMARIESWVAAGGVWIANDAATSIPFPYSYDVMPGAPGVTVTGIGGADINVLAPASGLITGPGGVITNTTLDGGNYSDHGYTTSTLPAGAVADLSTATATQIVAFDYAYGLGHAIIHTVPVEYYGGTGNFGIFHKNLFNFGASFVVSDSDYYNMTVAAGDSIKLSTRTPAGGPNEFANNLNPALDLYDPSGNKVATNDNGDPDGRNALLNYTATVAGTYRIRVYASAGAGEYVLNVNHAPRAANDAVAVAQVGPTIVPVLANDTDFDGDSLTVTAVGTATHGNVIINPDSTITYTPSAGYSGTDAFTYTISDGNGGTSSAGVSLTLLPVPTMQAITIDDGTSQRSMVRSITLTFDHAVTMGTGAVQLVDANNLATPVVITPSQDAKTFVLTFSGPTIVAGSLADGSYSLTLVASAIRDAANQPLSAGTTLQFTRFFGDLNGDGDSDSYDALAFRDAYGLSFGQQGFVSAFDYDGNGVIDSNDNIQFRLRLAQHA